MSATTAGTASQYITIKQAEAESKVSGRTLRSWVEKRWVRSRASTAGWLIERASLAAALDARARNETPDTIADAMGWPPEGDGEPASVAGASDASEADSALVSVSGEYGRGVVEQVLTGLVTELERARGERELLHAESQDLAYQLGVERTDRANLAARLAEAEALARTPVASRVPRPIRWLFGDAV